MKFLFLLLFLFSFSSLFSQGERYMRVAIDIEKENISSLASKGLAVDGYFSDGRLVLELAGHEVNTLIGSGYEVTVLIDDLTAFYVNQNEGFCPKKLTKATKSTYCDTYHYTVPSGFSLGSMGGFYTYDEILANLDSMYAWYPHLITAKTPIDTTTTIEGRPVYWVRISNNPQQDQGKTKIFYNALAHAREPASMQQMMFFMYYVLENYNTCQDITNIVDNFELYFVPCANPDGYIYNETNEPNGGGMWRKNRRNNGDGTFGVDLNRNFGYMWGIDDIGSSPDGAAQTYRGTGPFSEPETQLLKTFCESKNFAITLNYHTFSNLLLYPFAYAENTPTPDSATYSIFAELMTRENSYVYGTVPEVIGYMGNGDSSDWMYGEQQSKNKIFAFTPEAGPPAYGFWPPMSEIVNICMDNMRKNIYAAYLAGKFAHITDLTSSFVPTSQFFYTFNIKNIGLDSAAVFTVSLTPLSSNIASVGSPKTFAGLGHLNSSTDSIGIHLNTTTQSGDEILFLLHIDNGDYVISDTVRKYAGQKTIVLYDDASSMSYWNSNFWGTTTERYYSPPASINDRPYQDYQGNTTNIITLAAPVDLTQTDAALLQFRAKWFLSYNLFGSYYDYVQILISTNQGQSWQPLCGKYTVPANNTAIHGEPAYETIQDEWVREEINLNAFTGHNVLFRFVLHSDWLPWDKDEGFYFDDFTVFAADSIIFTQTPKATELNAERLIVYPNPSENYLNVRTGSKKTPSLMIIYNSKGQIIVKKNVQFLENIKIDTSLWQSGLYHIRLINEKGKDKSAGFIKL